MWDALYLLVNKKHLVEVDYMDIGIVINLVLYLLIGGTYDEIVPQSRQQ